MPQASKQHLRRLDTILGELLGVVVDSDRMQIDHAVDTVIRILELDPIAQRSEVVPQMDVAGGLQPGKDSLPIQLSILS